MINGIFLDDVFDHDYVDMNETFKNEPRNVSQLSGGVRQIKVCLVKTQKKLEGIYQPYSPKKKDLEPGLYNGKSLDQILCAKPNKSNEISDKDNDDKDNDDDNADNNEIDKK